MASPSSSKAVTAASGGRPDAFALLGVPARYDLPASELERAFHERTRELHPDKFATAPAAERVAALSRSRAINDAYQLLRRDASRAEYLLAREGVTIGDNERIDPALVMDLLEEREVLAEARAAGDLVRIETLCGAMRMRKRAALDEVKRLFTTDGDRAAIKQQLILLRYVERYLDECDAALDED